VGACIVDQKNNENKIVVATGHNKMPDRCDGAFPWARKCDEPDQLKTKYLYVCHAELNAILNSNPRSVKDCSMYVTLFPCNECAKLIIQTGAETLYLTHLAQVLKDLRLTPGADAERPVSDTPAAGAERPVSDTPGAGAETLYLTQLAQVLKDLRLTPGADAERPVSDTPAAGAETLCLTHLGPLEKTELCFTCVISTWTSLQQ
ncbi:hypothetical protein P4O66_013186, partial [Electrophorus voltai]